MPDKPIWLKSQWTAEQLDGESVEFRIFVRRDKSLIPAQGNGIFRSLQNHKGLTRIDIVVDRPGRTLAERVVAVFHCPKASANFIEKQKPNSKFAFSIFEFPAP